MKFVFDSNVIVAAFASRGLCTSIFEICLEKYTIVVSKEIVREVETALTRKIKLHPSVTSQATAYLHEFCTVSEFKKCSRQFSRDPDDNHVIGLALSSRVNYIVSGDDDLLTLKEVKSIPIISPRQVWDILRTDTR